MRGLVMSRSRVTRYPASLSVVANRSSVGVSPGTYSRSTRLDRSFAIHRATAFAAASQSDGAATTSCSSVSSPPANRIVPSPARASAATAYGGSPTQSVIGSEVSCARATWIHSGVRKMLAGERRCATADHAGAISDGTRAVQPASGLVERVTCPPSLGT